MQKIGVLKCTHTHFFIGTNFYPILRHYECNFRLDFLFVSLRGMIANLSWSQRWLSSPPPPSLFLPLWQWSSWLCFPPAHWWKGCLTGRADCSYWRCCRSCNYTSCLICFKGCNLFHFFEHFKSEVSPPHWQVKVSLSTAHDWHVLWRTD